MLSMALSDFYRRPSETFTVQYHTVQKQSMRITIRYQLNQHSQFQIEGKRLAKAITRSPSLESVPIGYCLAVWDVNGHLFILAEKIVSGQWSLRISHKDIITLDVIEIELMILHWSTNATRLCEDPLFQSPWATSSIAF
ncbi:hypothetical protein RSOLAG22IIIB_09960 [Rhizoctonia solani]|uniref:Uncharacterized protein n=1 Tax=Rhizoctonia solani TaxID=456999 RepID=A0A0K6G137_9AGAM|nr:hypothetical protein RSOLAG22IIIB_09960 [Rhizoctonia solani]